MKRSLPHDSSSTKKRREFTSLDSALSKFGGGSNDAVDLTAADKAEKHDASQEPVISQPAKHTQHHSHSQYAQFLSRPGPKELHSKQLPTAPPSTLANMTFVFTGVLPSTPREEMVSYVKSLGARVTSSLSKKTDYVVVGDDPGASKIAKSNELGVKQLTEDELIELVVAKSASAQDKEVVAPKKEVKKSPAAAAKKKPPATAAPLKKAASFPTSLPNSTFKPVASSTAKSQASSGPTLLSTKYKPISTSQIIGNNKQIQEFKRWLDEFSKRDQKCCLISGPPGIGKTTTVELMARELGYELEEMNASDARSALIVKDKVKNMLNSHSIREYFSSNKQAAPSHKRLILMDEVDGMSAGDRGGLQELVKLIKTTRTPIVCICNDRQSQKIRTLSNYCLDLRFARPSHPQIQKRLLEICQKENINIEPNAIAELVQMTGGDIRQIFNILEMNKNISYNSLNNMDKKNQDLNIFDICQRLFHRISIADKLELFFNDYQLSPLFVQENYIKSSSCSLNQMAFNADILSQSEILSSFSQRKQEYSLLPAIGVLSVIPTSVSLNQRIQFPSLLGQISKINKASRLVKEISLHMSLSTTSQKEELRLEYYPVLIRRLNQLISGQKLEQAVEFMNDYNLLRTDYDSMTDMGFTPNTLTTQMKSQFTRLFNKSSGRVKYNLGYKGVEGLEEAGEQGEEETSEAVEEEDKMIVTKKAKTAAAVKKTKASAAKKTTTKKPTSKSKSKK